MFYCTSFFFFSLTVVALLWDPSSPQVSHHSQMQRPQVSKRKFLVFSLWKVDCVVVGVQRLVMWCTWEIRKSKCTRKHVHNEFIDLIYMFYLLWWYMSGFQCHKVTIFRLRSIQLQRATPTVKFLTCDQIGLSQHSKVTWTALTWMQWMTKSTLMCLMLSFSTSTYKNGMRNIVLHRRITKKRNYSSNSLKLVGNKFFVSYSCILLTV